MSVMQHPTLAAGGAMELSIAAHRDRMCRWAKRLAPDLDPDDMVQDTLVTALRIATRFDASRASLSTWLYGILHRTILNHRKKQVRRADLGAVFPAASNVDGDGDLRLAARQLMMNLNEAELRLLACYFVEGRPGEKVAEDMGLTMNAFWVRASRLRGKVVFGLTIH
jgi:RNA polymerase sigma factor (sigma-70 family)